MRREIILGTLSNAETMHIHDLGVEDEEARVAFKAELVDHDEQSGTTTQ